jgi:hypothetical protein
MTPQEIDTARGESAAIGAQRGSALTIVKAPRGPSLPLFAQHDTQELCSRWEKIQIGFVDDPRTAVVQADELVATAFQQLAEVLAAERHKLKKEWDNTTGDVSTEDLRVALRSYRSFFDRLLSV